MGIISKLRPKTIGFWAGDENHFHFLEPLMEQLTGFRVKKFLFEGDEHRLRDELEGVDVAWFEWGNGPIIPASHFESKTPIICRVHRYEVYSDAPRLINWGGVDKLIFSSPSMMKKFEDKFPKEYSSTKPVYIPIGVDTDLFRFNDKDFSKQIIYTGRIHPHKNPSLLFQILSALYERDSEYHTTVIGKFADELYEEYFYDQIEKLGLKSAITYLPHMEQDSLVRYLQEADHYLVTSIIEGLSQSSLEAMSCGARPVVTDYFGANQAYPSSCLYATVDQAVEKILHPKVSRTDSRKIVEDQYSLHDSIGRLTTMLKEMAK